MGLSPQREPSDGDAEMESATIVEGQSGRGQTRQSTWEGGEKAGRKEWWVACKRTAWRMEMFCRSSLARRVLVGECGAPRGCQLLEVKLGTDQDRRAPADDGRRWSRLRQREAGGHHTAGNTIHASRSHLATEWMHLLQRLGFYFAAGRCHIRSGSRFVLFPWPIPYTPPCGSRPTTFLAELFQLQPSHLIQL